MSNKNQHYKSTTAPLNDDSSEVERHRRYRRPNAPVVFMGWDEADESEQHHRGRKSRSASPSSSSRLSRSDWNSTREWKSTSSNNNRWISSHEDGGVEESEAEPPQIRSKSPQEDTYFMAWGSADTSDDEESDVEDEEPVYSFFKEVGNASQKSTSTDSASNDEAKKVEGALTPDPDSFAASYSFDSTLPLHEGGDEDGQAGGLFSPSGNDAVATNDREQRPVRRVPSTSRRPRPNIKVVNSFGGSIRFTHIPDDTDMATMPNEEEKESEFSARTSFTADSPYYTSYVEHEMRQVSVLSDTLRDISARSKTFGKCGALMSEATRRLALACRLKPSTPMQEEEEGKSEMDPQDRIVQERQEAVGEEMMVVLSTLGEVLDEIADAQVQMCESLEASLSHSLEAFCGTQVTEVTQLQAEADQMTEGAEQSFSKYLNGRQYASDDNVGSWNKLSEQVSSSFSKTWRESNDLSRFKQWRNPKDSKRPSDPSVVMAATAANLRLTLEQIRLAQTSAELKRFQLLQKLVSIKKRRNFELGESALASLHGIRAYFHHCSDLVEGLTPRMNRIQQTQKESRERHAAARQPWQAREQGLVRAMDHVGQSVAHAASLADMMANGEIATNAAQNINLSQLEEETQIWELPTMLAESSRYQREPAPGVFVEGWLYKKSASRISLQQWNKRWFMMDKDGIYYFRSSSEMKKSSPSGYLHTLERVKICDIVLCTVREISTDGVRFCFEIVTPNQKPLLLQARGPQEFRMWVDGIRSSIETQLTSGNHDADQLMKGIGKQSKKKKKKEGGMVDAVTTLASMLESETVPNRSNSGRQSSDDDDDDENEFRGVSAEADFRSSQTQPRNPLAKEIMDDNPVCADCGMQKPDWACINLGVLICIECSGVHRSLGVHVSKVRSLKLDSLSDSEGRLLLAMGNAKVNPIWESGIGLQQGWEKPAADATRQLKENWIKSKYMWKGFLEDHFKGKDPEEKVMYYNRRLFEAARNGELLGIAEALAYSAEVEWRNPDEEGKTALHVCALNRPSKTGDPWTGIECAELLLQNGAKMDAMDDNTQGVLDCAVIGNGEREMVEFLSARIQ